MDKKLYPRIGEEVIWVTLDNGLRLVHHEDRSTQMVALNIVYDVGARDEHPDHTGFAHLFEQDRKSVV